MIKIVWKSENDLDEDISPTNGHQCNLVDFHKIAMSILSDARPNEYMLVSIDIDNFKYINDLFGYETGDKVLELLSNFFSKNLMNRDIFCIANADNFLFLMSCHNTVCFKENFGILNGFRENLDDIIPDYYNLVFSAGTFVITDPSEIINSMIDKVNFARKYAKGNHRDTHIQYDVTIENELKWKKEVTTSMQSALKNREFVMYLQPKVMLKTSKIIGAEALVRWDSPKYGMLPPGKFISIFEQNGFINLLDFYILDKACSFQRKCIDENLMKPIPISVNFSRTHISTPNLTERIHNVIKQYDIPPNLIEIELTESVLLHDLQAVIEITNSLKALGFCVSIDDFGSEYSSLSCLKDLSVDIVKIDKGFLSESANTEKGKIILSRIVEMLKSIHLTTVMEGIETSDQADFLKKLKCDIVQGFYYSKPMPISEFIIYANKGISIATIGNAADVPNGHNFMSSPIEAEDFEMYVLRPNIEIGIIRCYLDKDEKIQFIDRKALDFLGYSKTEFEQIQNDCMRQLVYPDDRDSMKEIICKLTTYGKPMRFRTRAVCKDKHVIWLDGYASCVRDENKYPIGVFVFQDKTSDIFRENELIKELDKLAKENSSLKDLLKEKIT